MAAKQVRPPPAKPVATPVSLPPATSAPTALPPAPRLNGPVLLAQKGDWSVFQSTSGGGRTCFAATRPKDSAPHLDDRKPVFLYLTSYAPGDVRNEVTFKMGMPLDSGEMTSERSVMTMSLLARGNCPASAKARASDPQKTGVSGLVARASSSRRH